MGSLTLTGMIVTMLAVGGLLIYLGTAKNVEPVLLIPIGTGVILANIPLSGLVEEGGFLAILRNAGIETEFFPLLIFIGIGVMIGFGTFFLAYLLGDGWFHILDFSLRDAASIGIIGSADGPTSIYVSTMLGSKYAPAIVVAAYSYMALVPIIQPPIMKLLTTKEERILKMPIRTKKVSSRTKVIFPVVTIGK